MKDHTKSDPLIGSARQCWGRLSASQAFSWASLDSADRNRGLSAGGVGAAAAAIAAAVPALDEGPDPPELRTVAAAEPSALRLLCARAIALLVAASTPDAAALLFPPLLWWSTPPPLFAMGNPAAHSNKVTERERERLLAVSSPLSSLSARGSWCWYLVPSRSLALTKKNSLSRETGGWFFPRPGIAQPKGFKKQDN